MSGTEATVGVSLRGRTVLITGAGGGIGAGIATEMARQGATVVVNDYVAASAETMAAALASQGFSAFAIAGDVTDASGVSAMMAAIESRGLGVDVLVNNAGITGEKHVEDIDTATWNRVMEVNLTAPFQLSLAVLPGMRRRGFGRIINIASIAGIRISVLGGAAYTASKSGLIGLTRHLASELAPHGITVNAILPGVTVTPLVKLHTDAEQLARIEAQVPVGRAGTPTDVGHLATHLASDGASYITGAAIPVDGALTVLPGDYSQYRATRHDS